MHRRTAGLLLVAMALSLEACADRQSSVPTEPQFAGGQPSGGCNFTEIQKQVDAEFPKAGGNRTNQNVVALVNDMKGFFTNGAAANATRTGYGVMDTIAVVGITQGTATAGAALTLELFKCMTTGNPALVFTLADSVSLGPAGAYGVAGHDASDDRQILSHDKQWLLQPPAGESWASITTFNPATGLEGAGDAVAHLMLVFGKPSSLTPGTFTADVPQANSIFDWASVPHAAFSPGVVSGYCGATLDGLPHFIQHFPKGNANVEILPFVEPDCPAVTALPPAPSSLAGRLGRWLLPSAAQAALVATSTGGGKTGLSPDGVVDPGTVNLKFTVSPGKSGNTVNVALKPTPVVSAKSDGSSPFKQPAVLIYILGVVNNGTPAFTCFNWAYTGATGSATFPNTFMTKSGGYQLLVRTVGTLTSPSPTGQDVPVVLQGATTPSSSFQVKNAGTTRPCPTFDGTTFFTNILDPGAAKVTFDSNDPSTYPPM